MPKEKDVTIHSLVNEVNISIPIVSPALKDDPAVSRKIRKKFIELVDKMNYGSNHFARNVRSQKTNTIGVIAGKLTSNFMAAAIAGIENVANTKGYYLLMSQSSETLQKEAVSTITMFNSRVDGLLVSLAFNTGTHDHSDPFFDKIIFIILTISSTSRLLYLLFYLDNE